MKTLLKSYTRWLAQADMLLLAFLLFMMMDKVVVKPLALLIPLAWMYRSGWVMPAARAPLFYPLILAFLPIQYLITGDFSGHYLLYFGIGFLYWLMCWVAFSVMYARVQQTDTARTEAALHIFFLANLAVTAAQLLQTMIASGSVNPFGLWNNAVYGNSTGDYLKGIFLAPCYINFFCNAFFACWFLHGRHYILAFLAVVVLCLTTCNFAILFFLPLFLVYALTLRQKKAVLSAGASLSFIIVFYLFISSGNIRYLVESVLHTEHKTGNPALADTTSSMTRVIARPEDVAYFKKKKGKLIAIEETIAYTGSGIRPALTGAGIGNFSSLLAQRSSDLQPEKKSRLFRMLPVRISPEYKANHYAIEKRIYRMPTDWHSIQQLPASFFNQVLGEYGLTGLGLFLYGYVFFILKRTPRRGFLLPMVFLLGWFLLFDYLFEYLSVVILFELFFILQRKQRLTT